MPDGKVEYELSLRDGLTPGLDTANSAAQRLESTMLKVGAAVGIGFGIAAITGFVANTIDAGSKVENALTGLTTLLKDAAGAQAVITNTMEDATKTPFAFEGLLSANKALIGAGETAEKSREAVLNLSNAIAATGGGDEELQRMVVNLQQIKNVGKATSLDIKQFAIAGVNIYQVLADATGKPISKIKDMEISYDMLTDALKKAHSAGGIYEGGLENMAKNTSVQISNLGDSIFQLKVKIFNDMKPAIDWIISGVGSFIETMREAWDWVVRNKSVLESLAIGIGVAAAAYGVYMLIINGVAIATQIWTGIQWLLNAALTANPIGIVIAAIALFVAGIVEAYKHCAAFRAVLFGVWETVKEFGRIVGDIFSGLWHVIHGVFTLDAKEIKLGASEQVNAMFTAGERLGGAFKKGYDEGMADFNKDQEAEKKAGLVPTKKASKAGAAPVTGKEAKSKATGSKSTTIIVTIKELIHEYNTNVTNMKEGAGKAKDSVVAALTAAVNDFQIVADH